METMINGLKISYLDAGSGFPVVFLHGFPLNSTMWKPQMEGLAESVQSIVPDIRGFGDSELGTGPVTMDGLANDLAAFLDSMSFNAPILCGLSMGGYLAMAFCRRYARWLSGLVLVSTRTEADTDEEKARRDAMSELAKEKGVGAIADAMLPKLLAPKTYAEKPELVAAVKEQILKSTPEGIALALTAIKSRADAGGWLGNLKDLPTLVIHGADDQSMPVSNAEKTASLLPDVRQKIIPNAGHLLNLEQPELFNEALMEFIREF